MKPRSQNAAFTLVEILVAMAVLAMLLVLLSSLIGQVSNTWLLGRARADNYTKARVSLDLLDRDIRSALVARGLPGFQTGAGQADLIFFSTQQGPLDNSTTSPRPLSLVSYRVVDQPASNYDRGLQRGAQGFSFAQTVPFQAAGATFPAPATPLAENYYQVIGPGVLRMDFRFLSRDGSHTSRQFTWSESQPGTTSGSVAVCLLVADDSSLRVLDQTTGGYTRFLQQFDAAVAGVADGEFPLAKWSAALDSPTTFAGLPPALRQNVQVYERTIPLTRP